ncbi:hypothetical protein SCP_0803040 [Sparassis crispa]|uniref:Uncharacterized protein n=1 Tax=Sparassis crispa TaxID=139825 RepID=A0A401GU86_9APHY|nr:hypothetical protein SCP_0803040 [Sparassis crispa]GBE85782.1 hypothetical protein SCP_0803040 [Sparassis crispa]
MHHDLTAVKIYIRSASGRSARQSADACGGLGHGVSSNAASFTLAAYNPNGDNANDTGIPLVVSRTGVTEVTVGPSHGMLSTYSSYRQAPFPELSLVKNALLPRNGAANIGYSTDLSVASGAELEFEFSNSASELPPPAPIYCIVQNFSPAGLADTAMLAVNGAISHFSLCQSLVAMPEGASPLINVVYNATEDNDGLYVYSTCYSVVIHVVY